MSRPVNEGRTASDAFLEALRANGVDVAFSVFGTDHASLIESWARHAANGNLPPVPRQIMCQHEGVTINAAAGYAHFTGRAQAVFAHVDVGTLNLGAGVHNANRGRWPVLIFAGLAPWTENGERVGSRDNYVHWVQDAFDQRGSLREYVKWEYEVRSGTTFPAAAARGLQFAHSAPRGPVYIAAAREPLAEFVSEDLMAPIMAAPAATVPAPDVLAAIHNDIRAAKCPLVITTCTGAEPGGVEALRAFAEEYVVPVVEMRPYHVNMPADHYLHQGYTTGANIELFKEADLVLAINCPVPWVPSLGQPKPDAKIIWFGEDPIETNMPMRSLRGDLFVQVSARATLEALVVHAKSRNSANREVLDARGRRFRDAHQKMRAAWRRESEGEGLTASKLARLVADICGEDALVINEAVTNDGKTLRQLTKRTSNTLMGLAGSGLGLGLPAAFGAKLAKPDRDVVCLQGDGAYVFGNPSAVHWGSRAYDAPFLTVIYNNSGWRAVTHSTQSVHPSGHAAHAGFPEGKFPQPLELRKVVTAAGGKGYEVSTPGEAERAISEGLELVRNGTQVVVDARITD
ncbi:MAG: thiamine pyrophosphate-requiring protein [Bradyrhizobiaceae bacterium]|nr:thiamine pyrophosphate-requiring protein [Bradyrhizobiaceae bacterium]